MKIPETDLLKKLGQIFCFFPAEMETIIIIKMLSNFLFVSTKEKVVKFVIFFLGFLKVFFLDEGNFWVMVCKIRNSYLDT
jgi:hypothetical protein